MRKASAFALFIALLVGLWGLFAIPWYLPGFEVPITLAIPMFACFGGQTYAAFAAWVWLEEVWDEEKRDA